MLIERQHSIVKDISSNERIFTIVELGEADLGISIDKCLLIDVSNTLDMTYIVGILSPEIARW